MFFLLASTVASMSRRAHSDAPSGEITGDIRGRRSFAYKLDIQGAGGALAAVNTPTPYEKTGDDG